MKILPRLLLVSLAANLALAAIAVHRLRISSPSGNAAIVLASGKSAATSTTIIDSNSNASARRAPLWAGLGVESFDDAIARLRAAGCPPKELAAAIRGMIDAKLQESRRALDAARETRPYWKSYDYSPQPPSERNFMSAFAEGERLRRTYLYTPELFATEESAVAASRMRFGVTDVEKLRQLTVLESERNERQMLESTAGSSKVGEDRYKFDQQRYETERKQHDDAIKSLLTTDEYAAYELRNSPAAMGLRSQLESFRPSEAEYKALFELQKSENATFAGRPPTTEKAEDLRADYEAKVKAALGSERAADYFALQKAGSDTLPRLLNRLQIPLVSLPAISAIRDHTNTRAKAIRAAATLTADQRNTQLAALAAEAETNLGTIFNTSRSLDAYKDLKGEWLRTLTPKPGGP